jgi:hypothetical protein
LGCGKQNKKKIEILEEKGEKKFLSANLRKKEQQKKK